MTVTPAIKSAAKRRAVLDTNRLVSAVLFKGSTLRAALISAASDYQLIFSTATWDELAIVMQRDYFEKYKPLSGRLDFLADLAERVEMILVTSVVSDCSDPTDNKFLALAIDADAAAIVTGDLGLSALHPYRGIDILSPAEFVRDVAMR